MHLVGPEVTGSSATRQIGRQHVEEANGSHVPLVCVFRAVVNSVDRARRRNTYNTCRDPNPANRPAGRVVSAFKDRSLVRRSEKGGTVNHSAGIEVSTCHISYRGDQYALIELDWNAFCAFFLITLTCRLYPSSIPGEPNARSAVVSARG